MHGNVVVKLVFFGRSFKSFIRIIIIKPNTFYVVFFLVSRISINIRAVDALV